MIIASSNCFVRFDKGNLGDCEDRNRHIGSGIAKTSRTIKV